MFTGIIEAQGTVQSLKKQGKGAVLSIRLPGKMKIRPSESLAVNGVCLTLERIRQGIASFDCLPETLKVTALGHLKSGEWVNLEKPLTLQDLLGGHLVQGHVDGVGTLISEKREANSKIIRIKAPKSLCRYFVKKDSVAVDGVSLTMTEIFPDGFATSLIPTTLKLTALGRKKPGSEVNLEVHILSKLTYEFLKNHV